MDYEKMMKEAMKKKRKPMRYGSERKPMMGGRMAYQEGKKVNKDMKGMKDYSSVDEFVQHCQEKAGMNTMRFAYQERNKGK
mgnify:CR=1 FL=1